MMKIKKKSIPSGIYLVVDPSMEEQVLLDKLAISLTKDIAAVQIWDNFKNVHNPTALIQKICSLCAKYNTLVLINNQWKYLKTMNLDGVHFDKLPSDLNEVRRTINKEIIIGLTCGNNLDAVEWAAKNAIDYISFCSMFPSSSIGHCEIITHETVKKAAQIFNKPLFLAGGINPENLKQLDELNYQGIAVISGVMNVENPAIAIDKYRKNIKPIK
ncbi:thiamine phosphate synthase [Gelidibacter sp.]|uniref:thiamine phosphate synthase n=1 Tax=Gelidibacter sp. TaxID=2018083 RepID=UPI002C6F7961|nr:thiamine phosphate synthase [Gelidibacter sp.]HUH28722.1 thiamine phosphate synthase [Gelidibacter sp.]